MMIDFFHFCSPLVMTWPPLGLFSHLTATDVIIRAVLLPQCHCQCLFIVLPAQHTMFAIKVSSSQRIKESLLRLNIATPKQQWRVSPDWLGKWVWQCCYTTRSKHDIKVVIVALTNYNTTSSFTKTNHSWCRLNTLISHQNGPLSSASSIWPKVPNKPTFQGQNNSKGLRTQQWFHFSVPISVLASFPVVLIKYSLEKQLNGERVYSGSQFKSIMMKSRLGSLKQLVISHPQ